MEAMSPPWEPTSWRDFPAEQQPEWPDPAALDRTLKTLGGLPLYDEANVLDRETALRLWTQGSAWFSGESQLKGTLAPGMYADLAVLSSCRREWLDVSSIGSLRGLALRARAAS